MSRQKNLFFRAIDKPLTLSFIDKYIPSSRPRFLLLFWSGLTADFGLFSWGPFANQLQKSPIILPQNWFDFDIIKNCSDFLKKMARILAFLPWKWLLKSKCRRTYLLFIFGSILWEYLDLRSFDSIDCKARLLPSFL